MTLRIRKLLIVVVVGMVLLLSHTLAIATWLDQAGVIGWVRRLRTEFVTGTAITVILVLLVLVGAGPCAVGSSNWLRRCSVCGRRLLPAGRYCPECGGRM